VTDNLTGLIWLENANCAGGIMNWDSALTFANTLADGSSSHGGGDCGLSDLSAAGDWRLPNFFEAATLLHHGYTNPGLPNTIGLGQWIEGDPFTGVQTAYWASTYNPQNYQFAVRLVLHAPHMSSAPKTNEYAAWPMRGPDGGSSPAQVALKLAGGGIEFPDGSVQISAGGPPRVLVPKTGQVSCYNSSGSVISCTGTGQDGEYQNGAAWPNPRFTKRGDGTVKDNLTGLVWLEDANCSSGTKTWEAAITWANALSDGDCLLSDGSVPGEWRLPTTAEFSSLAYMETQNPAISNTDGTGHWANNDPFVNIVTGNFGYWTSTSWESSPASIHIGFPRSHTSYSDVKTQSLYAWPVREDR